MSLVQMYIQQLQYNPRTFMYQIEDLSNETLLELMATTFYSNKQIFDSIIHFCGQENIQYRNLHPYNKILLLLGYYIHLHSNIPVSIYYQEY